MRVGEAIGSKLRGGEFIELVSDLGGGKTVLVRGLAQGIESRDHVQSPSFTINRLYHGRDGIIIYHYDFHRLGEPGVLRDMLAEALEDERAVVVIEWSDIVRDILPRSRLEVTLQATDEQTRRIKLTGTDRTHTRLLEELPS